MPQLWKDRPPSKDLMGSRGGEGFPGGDAGDGAPFSGVDQAGIRNPPRANDPHERTLADGSVVKWCGLCGRWANNYRAEHPAGPPEDAEADEGAGYVATETTDEGNDGNDEPTPGVFAHLRASGII